MPTRALPAVLTALPALAAVLLPAAAVAQSFDRLHGGLLPPTGIWHFATAAADMDGDGDVDLVRAAPWSLGVPLELLTNDGEGRYTATLVAASFGAAQLTTITAADLDGDGDADLLLGLTLDPQGALDRMLRNDGGGVFVDVTAQAWSGNVADRTVRLAVFDMEGDGDLDVLCCNASANAKCGPWCGSPPSRLFRNDGAGRLVLAATFAAPAAPAWHEDVVVLDFDGDGRRDLLFCGPVPHVHRNLGAGAFDPAPIVPGTPLFGARVADLDGDGDEDLVGRAAYTGPLDLRRNDGGGTFTTLPLPAAPASPLSYAVGDLDGDGMPDLVVSSRIGSYEPGQTRLLRNAGGFTFQDVTAAWLEALQGHAPGVALLDVDNDGDLDLYHGNVEERLLLNDGRGRLARVEPWDPFDRLYGAIARAADLDGDGRPELLGFDAGGAALWWPNDGLGQFARAVPFGPSAGNVCYWPSATPFDADGDGDVDVLLGLCHRLALLRNDGNGAFTDVTGAALPADARQAASVEVLDFDGDGALDLAIARGLDQSPGGVQESLWRNDGSGTFTEVGVGRLTDPQRTLDLAAADFDGDGDVDLAAAGDGPVLLFDNDGTGSFTDVTAQRLPVVRGFHLLAADLDGDGDADLVVGGRPGGAALLRNDGAAFVDVAAAHLPPLQDTWWPQAGDVDGDGDLDLLIGSRLLVNDGAGSFAPTAVTLGAWRNLRQKHGLADVDGDGDGDALVGGLLRSLHRQLENALPPRLGMHGELRLHARGAAPGTDPVATLLLATGLARPAIPLGAAGSWQLDPARTFVHTTFAVPGSRGSALVRYRVPNQPVLLGTGLWAQAFFFHGPQPGSWHSGNALPLALRR